MVTIYNLLGGNTLLAGALCHGNTMLIAATHKKHVLALQAQVAHIDVGRHIDTGQVADVDRTVGVGQRTGHKGSFELFLHYFVFFSLPIFCLIRRCADWILTIS